MPTAADLIQVLSQLRVERQSTLPVSIALLMEPAHLPDLMRVIGADLGLAYTLTIGLTPTLLSVGLLAIREDLSHLCQASNTSVSPGFACQRVEFPSLMHAISAFLRGETPMTLFFRTPGRAGRTDCVISGNIQAKTLVIDCRQSEAAALRLLPSLTH